MPNRVLYSSATDGPEMPDPVPPWLTIITTAYCGLFAGANVENQEVGCLP